MSNSFFAVLCSPVALHRILSRLCGSSFAVCMSYNFALCCSEVDRQEDSATDMVEVPDGAQDMDVDSSAAGGV